MSKQKTQAKSSSARGGYRENAGRKSSWNHPDTCTIRIPKSFADQIIELAHRLDNGEIIDNVTESNPQGNDSLTKSKSVLSDSKASLPAQPGTEAIDSDTESKFLEDDTVTGSILAPQELSTKVTCLLNKQGDIDNVTESILLNNDTVTKSNFPSSESLTQSAHQPQLQAKSDNETESNFPDIDNVTKSSSVAEDRTCYQSIPDLNAAIAQAKTIVKAKKSARESIARLLSRLYSTQVSADDLKN